MQNKKCRLSNVTMSENVCQMSMWELSKCRCDRAHFGAPSICRLIDRLPIWDPHKLKMRKKRSSGLWPRIMYFSWVTAEDLPLNPPAFQSRFLNPVETHAFVDKFCEHVALFTYMPDDFFACDRENTLAARKWTVSDWKYKVSDWEGPKKKFKLVLGDHGSSSAKSRSFPLWSTCSYRPWKKLIFQTIGQGWLIS